MGSDTSYQEAGKHHHDTKSYNDQDVLASKYGGVAPQCITMIRVWTSQYIVGMETFYDGVSAGARMGGDTFGAQYHDFQLNAGEHISEVHGRSGELIDMLCFKTTQGREKVYGYSTGGSIFRLQYGDKIVKGFNIGFGGQLHFIGAHFGNPPVSKYMAPEPQPVWGGQQPAWGAPAPAPWGAPAPAPYQAPYQEPYQQPYQAPYQAPAPAPGGWGVPAPAPAPGGWGVPAPAPYQAPYQAPEYDHHKGHHGHHGGHHGHGGHMMPEPAPYQVPYYQAPTKSNMGGKQHGDTQYFDDVTGSLAGRQNI